MRPPRQRWRLTVTEGKPAPDGTVSPDAQVASPPPLIVTVPVAATLPHYHQLVSAGERAWAKRTFARIVSAVTSVLEYVHEHRKAVIAAAPAIVAYAAARGITVPAVALTALPLIVGAVPNRKAAS